MPNSYLVVMAGGSGTRFWPKSTSRRPKQLLCFGDSDKSLLLSTLERFEGLVPREQRMIVTTESLAPTIRDQVGDGAKVLGEPQARNTAPCIYWAAREIHAQDPQAVMMVMPADHYIPRVGDFQDTIKKAVDWASSHEDLVTLGVKPTRPETGYGYLETGDDLGGSLKVNRFVEKPDLTRAEEYVRAGHYLWNGGMFLWRVDVILKAFDACMPELAQAWSEAGGDVSKAYPNMTATSIDYGVMEKSSNVVTYTLDCGWDDVGNWTSLEGLAQALGTQREGGVVSAGELVAVNSKGHIVDAPGRVVAVLGVDDLIVVEQGEAILVAKKSEAQSIRKVVDEVRGVRPDLV